MEKRIGRVTHYYNRIRVAVIELMDELSVGDEIRIRGRTTDFTQGVDSMEVEHQKVQQMGPGSEVALKVVDRVRKGDDVYRVVEG